MKQKLAIALVSGGMYDRLYEALPRFEREQNITVFTAFRGTHPELNAHLATFDEPPYDLVSTHTKYAPSQKRFLAPLRHFDPQDFFPTVLEFATIDGSLYSVPRNIDLRLLHYRNDLMQTPPASWSELIEAARALSRPPECFGFLFPGMESGLFGTFIELAEAAGAHVFTPSLKPELNNQAGCWALQTLRDLYASGAVPQAIPGWHYDEVHHFFRRGRAAMVADWPGYYASYREPDSPVRDRFRLARMPAGPLGKVCCYAGCHTFALTRAGSQKEEAHSLLRFLTAPEQQLLDARQGSVPVRRCVMDEQRRDATAQDLERLELLSHSIATDLLVPPKLSQYPQVEDLLWRTVQDAMLGKIAVESALTTMEAGISEMLADAP